MTSAPWLLLDCNYLCRKAHHSTGFLKTGDDPTGVLFGFLRDVVTFQNHFQTHRVVFCFDHPPLLRKKMLPTYKESRSKTYEALPAAEKALLDNMHQQRDLLRDEVLEAIGFNNVLSFPGYEADDVIAAVCKQFALEDSFRSEAKRRSVVMVTSDEDMWQLLRPAVTQWNPVTKTLMTIEAFQAMYGVHPERWAEVKAIAGCDGDDIKGIHGIGEKTAAKYLADRLPPTHKAFQAITRKKNIGNGWDANLALTRLPLPGLPKRIELYEDQVTRKRWKTVTAEFGLSDLKPPAFSE
jgi:DNA polymerase-1